MAKNVTEDDLAAGMKGLGGFGALSTRRDSPFRDSRAEVKSVEAKTIEIKPQPESSPSALPTSEKGSPVEAREPAPEPVIPVVVKPSAPATAKESPRTRNKTPTRKADVYTERVTLQMSAEMRDAVDELARQLQRAKTSKDERITANTVMRVAIRLLTENFELGKGEGPNNEEELYSLASKRIREK